ncbi:MAG TPA: hypothetical protein VNG12_27020 [Acidimicrobiales bacterium]|nr:hypothetical protein [Acidimicrobiales bacterium]
MHDNDLDSLPLDLAAFLDFYDQRKERMRQRLLKMLGVTEVEGSPASDPVPQSTATATLEGELPSPG